jgi:hypothetical protein
MTAWDFADLHMVFVAMAFFSTLALIGLCTLARLAWILAMNETSTEDHKAVDNHAARLLLDCVARGQPL